jgi:hypothetical protein
MSDRLGAQAYLESLRAENTMMEHEIKRVENATKKDILESQNALSEPASTCDERGWGGQWSSVAPATDWRAQQRWQHVRRELNASIVFGLSALYLLWQRVPFVRHSPSPRSACLFRENHHVTCGDSRPLSHPALSGEDLSHSGLGSAKQWRVGGSLQAYLRGSRCGATGGGYGLCYSWY